MALHGIRVVELAGLAPAPFCGMILADFGASVIRVDKTVGALGMDCLANGKKSLALDLKHPKGQEIMRKLCRESDVLIEPFRKGVMEKLGLDPATLLADNPRLIYARLTGFGQRGPFSKMAGHDINYLSMSGLLSMLGRRDEIPSPPLNLLADFAGGGLTCAFGIVMALLERVKSGKGQVVDSSMVEGSAYVGSWIFRSQHLPIWGQSRGNNLLDTGTHFYETYKTKDGKFMAVGALEPQFYAQLIEKLGLSEEEAPQMPDGTDKTKELFKQIFAKKTQQEWCNIFDETDACVTPVLSLEEAAKHSHNKESGSFTVSSTGLPVPCPAPKLSRTPGISKVQSPDPQLGEHTKEILLGLKYSEKDIEALEQEGIISTAKDQSKL